MTVSVHGAAGCWDDHFTSVMLDFSAQGSIWASWSEGCIYLLLSAQVEELNSSQVCFWELIRYNNKVNTSRYIKLSDIVIFY